jgi:hypothetical protein
MTAEPRRAKHPIDGLRGPQVFGRKLDADRRLDPNNPNVHSALFRHSKSWRSGDSSFMRSSELTGMKRLLFMALVQEHCYDISRHFYKNIVNKLTLNISRRGLNDFTHRDS